MPAVRDVVRNFVVVTVDGVGVVRRRVVAALVGHVAVAPSPEQAGYPEPVGLEGAVSLSDITQ